MENNKLSNHALGRYLGRANGRGVEESVAVTVAADEATDGEDVDLELNRERGEKADSKNQRRRRGLLALAR